jgi:outer membrane protein TolC
MRRRAGRARRDAALERGHIARTRAAHSDVTVSAGVKRVTTGGVPNNQAVVGVSIPIPLFNTNKGALLEATHKAERANADLDRERTSPAAGVDAGIREFRGGRAGSSG